MMQKRDAWQAVHYAEQNVAACARSVASYAEQLKAATAAVAAAKKLDQAYTEIGVTSGRSADIQTALEFAQKRQAAEAHEEACIQSLDQAAAALKGAKRALKDARAQHEAHR